jgi:hypothetical protein
MNTITKEQIANFATQMLGLSHDEEAKEFFSIYGQYAQPELVGTRRIVSEQTILAQMEKCLASY